VNKRTVKEELGGELAAKAVICGPAIAGAVVAGPVGLLVGAAIGIAALLYDTGSSTPPSGGDPPKE
jgi:hypothetical protein